MASHIVPVRTYLATFVALMGLLALTVAAAFIHLGRFNFLVMALIAGTKALLVMLYFMHIRYGNRLNWLVAVSGIYFLGILIALVGSDYLTRHWLSNLFPGG